MEGNTEFRKLRIPSFTDLAISLGRSPRFSGRTEPVWTVLHHSLVVETIGAAIAAEKPKHFRDNASAYLALHDAHEYWTGDIPTPFKTDEIRELQHDMDRQIRSQYGIPEPPPRFVALVKEADKRALAAEATLVKPERYHYFVGGTGMPIPEPQDVDIVHFVLENYGTPHYTMYRDSPAVEAFVKLVEAGISSFK